MFERFTKDARAAVISAQQHAHAAHAESISTVRVLQALTDPTQPTAKLLAAQGITGEVIEAAEGLDDAALSRLGIDLGQVTEAVEAAFGPGALDRPAAVTGRQRRRWFAGTSAHHLPFTSGAKKALELSLRETIRVRSRQIDSFSVLLGVLRAEDPAVTAILYRQRVDVAQLRADAERHLSAAA